MAKLFAKDTIGPLYAAQLAKEHDGSKWGSTGGKYSGNDVVRILRERPYIKTVLDFGAGKGSMGKLIASHGIEVDWTNYDPGMPEYSVLPDKQFDLVTTTDVLEHVEPDRIKDVIKALVERTGKVLYNDIACTPTGKLFGEGPYKGQDLHILLQNPEEWRKLFVDCGLQECEYQWKDKRSKGSIKTRCMMLHERV